MYETTLELPAEKISDLSPLSKNILRVILYFDIFQHPLKAEEIYRCCSIKGITRQAIKECLAFLTARKLLTGRHDFYFLGNNQSYVLRRTNGEKKARKSLKTARRFSALISKFPFVRGVYISGSLSKGYMDREADIDYFIVTKPGRLWLSRTLLILFKKIFLLNSRKYFCVNYFVDSDSLSIPDTNFFTATELVFILPTYNYELYLELMNKNLWIKTYYPYFPLYSQADVLLSCKSSMKNFIESILGGRLGEKLDIYFFETTLKHWKKKFTHFDKSTFDHRLRSKKNVSKHHPKGFQEKILTEWNEKIKKFEIAHDIEIQ